MKSFPLNILLIVLLISMSKSIVEFKDVYEPSQQFLVVLVSGFGGDETSSHLNPLSNSKKI